MNIKIKKIVAKIGVGLLILFALVLVVRTVLNFTSGKKLERVIQIMKGEGVPLTLKEIEPDCDPADNAATPWKAAEAVYSKVTKDQNRFLLDSIEDLFFRRHLNDQRRKELQEIISDQQASLRFLVEASTKSCFKYEDNWVGPPSSLIIPDGVKILVLQRQLGLDSYLKAESGQIDEALELGLAGMHFVEVYLQQPFLINYLIALAGMKTQIACFQRILEDFPMDTAYMKKIIEKLDPILWREELLLDFRMERMLAIESAFSYLDGKLDIDEGKVLDDISIWLFKPYLKSGMANILGAYNEYEKSISLPYFESRDAWEKITEIFDRPFYKKITGLLFPDFTVVKFKLATLEAMLHSIRLGLGCRIYKEERGSYPENLSELTPSILSVEPVDPFTGKPYIYQINDQGLIIYSIGNNLKDDQGRGTWVIDRLVLEKDDDWAWKDKRK